MYDTVKAVLLINYTIWCKKTIYIEKLISSINYILSLLAAILYLFLLRCHTEMYK